MLAAELAVWVIASNVNLDGFIRTIQRLGKRRLSNHRATLSQVLLLPEQTFHVLVPVTGARTFGSVEALDPDLKMRQIVVGQQRAFSGWDVAGHRAREFAEAVTREPSRGPREVPLPWRRPTLITMDVHAYDRRAAATIARRRVAEVLDQYVAGHPWARFEIVDAFGVAADGRSQIHVVTLNPPSEDSVSPLAIPWPRTLRQAMRVSHLVREATAPMTRIALAWVALEAAGIRPTRAHFESLARSLALLLMRQSVLLPYRLLAQDALESDRIRPYDRRGKLLRRFAEQQRLKAAQQGMPPAVAFQKQLYALRLELLSGLYGILRERYREDVIRRRNSLSILNASVNPDLTGKAQTGTYLRTMVRWGALLESNWEASSKPDASALRQLLDSASLLTRAEIRRISDILRSPQSTANLLSEHKKWIAHALHALYAARNLNLHSGLFESEGDVALAHLAVLVIDASFETWGTWYEPAPSSPLEAKDVITRLGSRFDRCMTHLARGGSAMDLDLDSLTRPTWSPTLIR